MIKLTFCLRRLPALSRAQFQTYWRETHGPLVRRWAPVLRIQRYVQLHSAEDATADALRGARGSLTPDQAPYDGVAQLWWSSWEDLAAAGAHAEAAQAGRELLEDEARFIDLPRSPLWWGEEVDILNP